MGHHLKHEVMQMAADMNGSGTVDSGTTSFFPPTNQNLGTLADLPSSYPTILLCYLARRETAYLTALSEYFKIYYASTSHRHILCLTSLQRDTIPPAITSSDTSL